MSVVKFIISYLTVCSYQVIYCWNVVEFFTTTPHLYSSDKMKPNIDIQSLRLGISHLLSKPRKCSLFKTEVNTLTSKRTNTQQGISESPIILRKHFSRNTQLSEPIKNYKGYLLCTQTKKEFGDTAKEEVHQPLRIQKRHNESQESYDLKTNLIKAMNKKSKQALGEEIKKLRSTRTLESNKELYKRNSSSQPVLDIKEIKKKISFISRDNIGISSLREDQERTHKVLEVNKKLASTLNMLNKIKQNIKDVQVDLKKLEKGSVRRPRNKTMFKTELNTLKKRIKRLVMIAARQKS